MNSRSRIVNENPYAAPNDGGEMSGSYAVTTDENEFITPPESEKYDSPLQDQQQMFEDNDIE